MQELRLILQGSIHDEPSPTADVPAPGDAPVRRLNKNRATEMRAGLSGIRHHNYTIFAAFAKEELEGVQRRG